MCMTSPTNFFCSESENLALIICKFIPLIQCIAFTRNLLHYAMFSIFEQLAIKFCSYYALNLKINHCINRYKVIVNYINTNRG